MRFLNPRETFRWGTGIGRDTTLKLKHIPLSVPSHFFGMEEVGSESWLGPPYGS